MGGWGAGAVALAVANDGAPGADDVLLAVSVALGGEVLQGFVVGEGNVEFVAEGVAVADDEGAQDFGVVAGDVRVGGDGDEGYPVGWPADGDDQLVGDFGLDVPV